MPLLVVNKNDVMRDEMIHNAHRVVRFENGVMRNINRIWLRAQRQMRSILGDLYEPMETLDATRIIDWTNQLGYPLADAITEIEAMLSDEMSGLITTQARILGNKFKRIYDKEVVESQMQELYVDVALVNEILNAPSPFDGLVWTERFDYLDTDMRRRLRGSISRSITEGTGIQGARKSIQDNINLARDKSELIARTEIMRVNNEIQRRIYDDNKDILSGIQYLAVLDRRTCLICGSVDGNIYYYNRSPSVEAAPIVPQHGRCRCTYTPIVKMPPGLEKEKVIPERITYRQWFDKQKASVKKDIFGPSRYALYKMGRYTPNKFVDDGRILPLRELDVEDFATGELARKEISALLADLEMAERLNDKKMIARIKRWLKAGGYELKKKGA